ncbi:CotH kinase family protein [Oceanirhabdus seepicola]|uniref:CotH kinase family protein n=1 Tax=Oceanirhabdus seepicola TaxID=2828781 RepID=A0A9J6P206_9CLOT|nr:CotH kinase family protein [Oceanirhabdus seepicola]MCM1990222.1 CotH kinase family protein [Oceanirhabdus seepicola]
MNKCILKLLIILLSFMPIGVACSNENINNARIKGESIDEITQEESTSQEWEQGNNLPVIVIDTNGVKINGTEKINGTMKFYNSDNELNYRIDEPAFTSNIGIKIRGRSSRKFPKKQYSLELRDEQGTEKEKKILGMSKDSDWVLNAPFEDKSLIRNYMAYNISGKIMNYAPGSKFCEVYLLDDGSSEIEEKHYKGLYLMIEKIKRGNDRVDILPSQDDKGETSFIVAKDQPKEGDIVIQTYGKEIYIYDYGIVGIYPNRDITDNQIDYISKTISEFERVLYSDKYDVVGEGYGEHIDVDSFVDYFIINEFFNNTDAGIFSTYIYKDYGEKIKAGPVWDFNISMGNSNLLSEYYDYAGFYMPQTSWFERLMRDKKFVSKVINRYKLLRKTYFSDEYLIEFIDDTVELLGDAPERNFTEWPIYLSNQAEVFKNNHIEIFAPYEHDVKLLDEFFKANPRLLYPTEGMAQSYEEEIRMLKEFLINRGAWIDENIESLYKWTD